MAPCWPTSCGCLAARDPAALVIRGYVEQPSPRPGEDLVLRVSTDAPQFRVEFYRCGVRMEQVGRTGWLPGEHAPLHLPNQDWGLPGTGFHGEDLAPWPAYPVQVPAGWRSGVHVAVLVEGDDEGRDTTDPDRSTPDAREGTALFVVRATSPGRVLYKIPLLTYFAYDLIDGEEYDAAAGRGHWCFYNPPRGSAHPLGLGLHRPGGGTGAVPYDIGNWDPYDPTPRQTFVHWDARFVAWLEDEGIEADYCTDVDLHRDGQALLDPYRLLVSVGHDEYWSEVMRDAVEGFVAAGGNAAFFSGNTCWWRVVFDDEVTFRRTHNWEELGRPENALLGVSFRNGGERDRDEHPERVGFQVQHADHWVYAGTGLRDGDVFGRDEHVVGYECDGAEFDRADLAAGRPVRPTGADGTPADFTILGMGDARAGGWGLGNGAATLGVHSPGGTVFTASTTDWARALTSPVVARITRNVLDRLGGAATGR